MKGSKLLLGISGSIAAYKTAELVRQLKKAGASVQVIMTPDAGRFITPLTLSTLSGKETLIDIFPEGPQDAWTQHIELGLWADLFVIAPATAQTMAKLAHGFCDNMLTAVALAARCPLLICPAMDHDMYIHPATQSNLQTLTSYGYRIMPPEEGELASGLVGKGRLPDPQRIVQRIDEELSSISSEQPLAGKKVLVTAGPTREALDPVRFISNHSTGTMGYALAAEAQRLGGEVVLVSGPTHLPTPSGVHKIDVSSASDMADAVFQHQDGDLIIMAAAVADYTPIDYSAGKIKKGKDDLSISLKRTTDILATLGKTKRSGQCLVGFALETDNMIENALRKLEKKNLDWIVLNSPNDEGAGFGLTTNKVTLLKSGGHQKPLPLLPKSEVAREILSHILSI